MLDTHNDILASMGAKNVCMSTHTCTHTYKGHEAASLLQRAVELTSASTAKCAQHRERTHASHHI